MAGRSAEKSEFRWYHGLVFALSVFLCTDRCRESIMLRRCMGCVVSS